MPSIAHHELNEVPIEVRAKTRVIAASVLILVLPVVVAGGGAGADVPAQTEPAADFVAIPGPVVVEFDDEVDAGAAADHGHHRHAEPEQAQRRGEERRTAQARADEIVEEIRESYEAGNPTLSAPSVEVDGIDAFDIAARGAVIVGGITIAYNTANPTPNNAKSSIEAGIGAWADALATNGAPIVVDVNWVSFGNPSVLGFAGPTDFITGAQLPTGHFYPAAMANVLAGTDFNGTRPEITVTLNADLDSNGDWHYGLGAPPAGKIDLTTVVTHEMGHGVGFVSSASDKNGPIELASPPFIYDALTTRQGTPITNLANVGAALTSGDADIRISDGQSAPLFVPSTWYQGSSASHFLNTGVTAASLMSPALSSGTSNRTIDGFTLGVLEGIGWDVLRDPIEPLINGISANGTLVTVSWVDRNSTSGLPADRYSIEAYRGTTRVTTVAVDGTDRNAQIGGLAPNTDYSVRVIPITNNTPGSAASAAVTTGNALAFKDPDPPPSFVRELWLDHQIFRVYQGHFLRAPDQVGFNFWFNERARGASLLNIIAEFQAGTEFVNRYGSLSDAQFVSLVYNNVLGRNADNAGFDHWTALLAGGMTRAEMMLSFVEGPEYITRTATVAAHSPTEGAIRRLYQAYFLRVPPAADLDYWVGVANSGTPLVSIADFFSASTEFTNTYGNVSDGAFVNLVYQNVLDRPADGAGFAHWTGQLAAGRSRGDVMVGFSESTEFVKSTGTIP